MNRTREEQIEIANEIIKQLGGNHFRAMTGARDMMAIDKGLAFGIPRTKGINKIRIILEPDDTYTVTFWHIQIRPKHDCRKISEHSMVYNDMLQSIFTAETGLDTHL